MSKALSSAGALKPDIRLAQALSVFEASLSSDDKARLRSYKFQWQDKQPTVDDVMRLTAEADAQAKRSLGSGRCFGPRLTYMLQSIQQFAALGDILVGGSQNLIACGVWSVVRIAILAATLSASGMERLSLLFMTAGRSAPRYQGLAILYARSRLIRDYLAEYMIIVVQMCHHFHDFGRKSTFAQITSSLNESRIRNAEEELNRWAQLIKDEANFLLAQTTENEAIENNKIRKWLSRSMKSNSDQQNMDKRLQWLTAFSTFDFETPWKQARKRGSSSCFVDARSYKQWKQRQGPHTLLVSGKMGCGKSVVMANMVDDLSISCPEDVIIYFFCRHDIPESLSARTVFGSFAAQICQRHIGTDMMDEILTSSVPSFMNLDRVLRIIPAMIKFIKGGIRFVLDGADECPEEEFELIQAGLLKLSVACDILSCVSYRDQADGLQAKIWNTGHGTIMSMPNDNPDIAGFIEAELQRLHESGKLSLGDISLLITIRETLLRGANGMFLWVALQLDTICAEKTDYLIRQALKNLPRSLSATFRRILEKSKQEGHCYQKSILKILAGAKRPLTVAEFREALSVKPGDILWDPRKLINNIYSTLACCGSLVTIDEEEGTVRLLHQSVTQFLQTAGPDSMEWSFTAHDADSYMGEIILTYLNYGIFDKRLSTRVIPQIYAGGAPRTIVNEALSPLGTFGKRFSDTMLKRERSSDRDIGKILFKFQSFKPVHEDFDFLVYSSENLLSHTGHMSWVSSLMIQLFKRLLIQPQFRPWSEDKNQSDGSVLRAEPMAANAPTDQLRRIPNYFDMASEMSLRINWAISNSHALVLSTCLHDRLGLIALCSINSCLIYLRDTGSQLNAAPHMCDKLLLIATLFRDSNAANWLITTNNYSLDQYLEVLRSSDACEYPILQWAVLLDCFGNLNDVVEPLIEEAIAHQDLYTVKRLLRKGANPDTFKFEPPLRTAMRLLSTKPEYLVVVSPMVLTVKGWELFKYITSDISGFDSSLFRSVHLRALLSHACERGDQAVVKLILDGPGRLSAFECNELLCKTLSARSHERADIVTLLLTKVQTLKSSLFQRAVVCAVRLQDWRSAFEISFYLDAPLSFPKGCLQACLESRDVDGVKFLYTRTRPPNEPMRHPFLFLITGYWDCVQDCCKVLQIATIIEELVLGLDDEAIDYWALNEHHDHSVLELCHLVLDYIGMESHLTTESITVVSLLCHLSSLLEYLSDSFPFPLKSVWLRVLGATAEAYRNTADLIPNVHLEDINTGEFIDSTELLRLSIVKIAETLLRKCSAFEPSLYRYRKSKFILNQADVHGHRQMVNDLRSGIYGHWQFTDADWKAMAVCDIGWSLSSIMGMTLRIYGFRREAFERPRRKVFSPPPMPLGWQAYAAGPRLTQLLRNHGFALDQLRAAELSLPCHSDWSDEIRMAGTIVQWRVAFCGRPSVANRVELLAEIPTQVLK